MGLHVIGPCNSLQPAALHEHQPTRPFSLPPTPPQSTLNRLGIIVAAAFLLPQLVWGWQPGDCAQFVGPLSLGWFLFDIVYMVALLLKLRML